MTGLPTRYAHGIPMYRIVNIRLNWRIPGDLWPRVQHADVLNLSFRSVKALP